MSKLCDVILKNGSKFDKLEQIQKRAARFITGEYSKLTRITPLVKSLNLETLEDRRTKSKVVLYTNKRQLILI